MVRVMTKQQGNLPISNAPLPPQKAVKETTKQSVVFLVRSDVKKELERGKRKFEQGDWESAKLAYEQALDLDPGCAIAYFYLGFTHHELGDLELAKEYYLQSIDLDRKQVLFLEHLARLHFELEEYSVCLVRFQEAQAVGPLQPISYGLMGRAHYELDRYSEAVNCLEMMLGLEVESRLRRIAMYYLVLSHLRDGSMIPARKRALSILEETEIDRLILSALGDKFQGAGCLSLAASFLERMKDTAEPGTDRTEELNVQIQKAESRLAKLFSSDEEKLLHHLHFISQYGTDRIYRVILSLKEIPSPLVREAILSYCRKFGYPVEDSFLFSCLSSEPIVQEAALFYLCETFDRKYLDRLLPHLGHPSREVQLGVARFLERCGNLDHLGLLESQMDSAVGNALRRQIQRSINQIKRRHTEQTDSLIHKSQPPHRLVAPRPVAPKSNWIEWTLVSLTASYLLFRLALILL